MPAASSLILFFLSCFFSSAIRSQDSLNLPRAKTDGLSTSVNTDTTPQGHFLIINDIFISGNKKTKGFIITRELPFSKGDTVYLPQLVAGLQRSKELLI